jgi:hypothetical protein
MPHVEQERLSLGNLTSTNDDADAVYAIEQLAQRMLPLAIGSHPGTRGDSAQSARSLVY